MRKITLALILMCSLMSAHSLIAQVNEKISVNKDTLFVSRDSMVQLIRIKDSLLHVKRRDSIKMANLIVSLEFNRDSLNYALNESIYRQKLDSSDRMRRYLSYRDFNRRSRQELYLPIGIIDKDSIRSSMKKIVDIVFEDTAYTPRPQLLRSSMDQLVHHLNNDSVYFRIVNAMKDTIPFVLKKDRIDSTAFFVMNSKNDSAKIFIRSLDKNTMYMWVGDDLNLKPLLKKNATPEGIGINWQDPNKFRVSRRTVPLPPPRLWYLKSELMFTVNQTTFINWARGGNNNIAFTSDVRAWANYAKGNIKWDNYFWFWYGVQKTELLSLRKSADKIYLVSNLSHKAFKKFDYTLGMTFDTQGFKGYAYPNDSIPVSKFMAPADLKVNLGLTFKPNAKLTVNGSPLTSQFRFVLDTALIDQARYGLKKDQRANAQLGASITVNHSTVLFKTVTMTNFLNLFSNYLDHPERIYFDWRLGLQLKVNKYIFATIQTEVMYDPRTEIQLYKVKDGKKVPNGTGKRVQFNEILGLTFKYTFY
ncbi:MAG: DUF3078 domain-containing protein [Bacteroidia bacterium]|nr:DUF3078 domain-containing protein [Bacteroidia bacterium]